MRRLTSIVAVSVDGAIGAQNRLPWRVRSDLRFFREQTVSHVVIMGRRTYDSLGGCLPERTNIIVTHGFGMFASTKDCRAAGGIAEAIAMADDCRKGRQEVFVIGGSSMYEQFSPYVDRYLITEIHKRVENADSFFSTSWLGPIADWRIAKVKSGEARPPADEAAFDIYEFVRRNGAEQASRREGIIAETRRRRTPTRFLAEPSSLRVSA